MPISTITRRWLVGATLAALALTALAPVAQAGRGPGDGRKVRAMGGPRVIQRVVYPQRTAYVRHSSSNVAPVLAGLIGGFVLGTLVSQDAPMVEASYAYGDPYCGGRYASLQGYEYHLRHCRHPRLVRVIDVRSGECVRSEVWRDGGWYGDAGDACREDGRDRYGDRYDDRYDDRR